MRNFVQSGVNLTIPSPANIISGQGVKVGSIFGVASGDAKTGEALDLVTEGVFALPRAQADTFAVGDIARFDDTTGLVTTAAAKPKIGYVVAITAATANVRLIPSV